MTRLVVIGDSLLDRDVVGRVERICPDAPVPVVDVETERERPGGAALAASLLAGDGVDVTLVTALGDDEAGAAILRLLLASGVEVVDCGLHGPTPQKVRVRVRGAGGGGMAAGGAGMGAGQSLLRLDLGGPPCAVGGLAAAGADRFTGAGAVLVSDYGRGLAAHPSVAEALARLGGRVPVVWDPHPRGPDPVAGTWLATPNDAEAAARVPQVPGSSLAAVTARARALTGRWPIDALAVTLGAGGALLARRAGPPLVVPAPAVDARDTCGAGDRFAGAAALALASGMIVPEAVEAAVAAASAFVAAGGAGSSGAAAAAGVAGAPPTPARLGTVVATGGCFDLLHAGHVATLQAARRLGDRLVVLVNSDDSVRRLKGLDRPLQPVADRVRVLSAIDGVDEVIVFEEDTPVQALERLRPDVWVKGADYSLADLPETEVLAAWGGQAVVVPYLDGRSTTRLVHVARHEARRGRVGDRRGPDGAR